MSDQLPQQAQVTSVSATQTAQSPMVSPLATVAHDTLTELFSRRARDLTDEQLLEIIQKLRAARVQWQVDEAQGAKSAKKAKATAPKALAGPAPSLGDLGL